MHILTVKSVINQFLFCSKHGPDVADQLIEVAVRVEAVRPFSVEMMLSMILNESLLMGQVKHP